VLAKESDEVIATYVQVYDDRAEEQKAAANKTRRGKEAPDDVFE
jgi:hypothetical protein